MTTSNPEFLRWFASTALLSPDSDIDPEQRSLDAVRLANGADMWAGFYGEQAKESPYKGTEGETISGHVHFDFGTHVESYLPTPSGRVIHFATRADGEVHKKPTDLTEAEEGDLIRHIESLLGYDQA